LHSVTAGWASDTRAFYSSRGIGARVGLGVSPAVLVVDMTRSFTDPGHPVGSDQDAAVAAIASLLGVARAREVPVVYTTLAFLDRARDAGTWGRKMPALEHLRLDDPASVEIDPRIAPASDDLVLNKRGPSAFFGTGLVSLLIPQRIDTLIVTGCATSGCVRATVVDALSYGYRVAVPATCVADRAAGPHDANLFDIDAKYADVLPLGDVTAYLESLDGRR
jgi:nicotinamidase-related amidase